MVAFCPSQLFGQPCKDLERKACGDVDFVEGPLMGICVAKGSQYEVSYRRNFLGPLRDLRWYPKDSLGGGEYVAYPSGNGRGNIPGPSWLGCLRAEALVRACKIKK